MRCNSRTLLPAPSLSVERDVAHQDGWKTTRTLSKGVVDAETDVPEVVETQNVLWGEKVREIQVLEREQALLFEFEDDYRSVHIESRHHRAKQ